MIICFTSQYLTKILIILSNGLLPLFLQWLFYLSLVAYKRLKVAAGIGTAQGNSMKMTMLWWCTIVMDMWEDWNNNIGNMFLNNIVNIVKILLKCKIWSFQNIWSKHLRLKIKIKYIPLKKTKYFLFNHHHRHQILY